MDNRFIRVDEVAEELDVLMRRSLSTISLTREATSVSFFIGLHITLFFHIAPRTTVCEPFLSECIFADSGRQRFCQKHFNGI